MSEASCVMINKERKMVNVKLGNEKRKMHHLSCHERRTKKKIFVPRS